MKTLTWLWKATTQTAAGNAVLLVLCLTGVGLASAATSYDVTNEPQMNLDVSITTTQVTGIVIATPQLNAADHTFATTTGGVLRIRWGNYREDLYFTGATVNATTKKVTLLGVTRNLCPQVTRAFTSCGDGRQWGKGAIVELIQDARLFNLKANIDRANAFTASGAINFPLDGSGTLKFPIYSTTAERDHDVPSPQAGQQSCVIATGLCYHYIGGTWTAYGSNATANASTTVAGKVETATVANISGAVVTDDTGAPVVLTTDLVIRRSTGAINDRNKIIATNNDGYMSGSLLPQLPINKFNNGTNATGTAAWLGNGTWGFPGTYCKPVFATSGSSALLVNPTTETAYSDHTYTIPANTLVSGVWYEFETAGVVIHGTSGTFNLSVASGSTSISDIGFPAETGTRHMVITGKIIGTTTAGASAKVRSMSTGIKGNSGAGDASAAYSELTLGTNGNITLTFRALFGTSDAGNKTGLTITTISKCSTSVF